MRSRFTDAARQAMCWVCMAFFVFVVVLLTLEHDTRQALLVTPLWFIALGLGWLCSVRSGLLNCGNNRITTAGCAMPSSF
ncbi:hypothetical protein ACNKHS_25315 [Shigella flexneri]